MRRQKIINGVSIPNADMRGRAFPNRRDDGPKYIGPAVVDGQVYRMAIWENESVDGRTYLRIMFEPWDHSQSGN